MARTRHSALSTTPCTGPRCAPRGRCCWRCATAATSVTRLSTRWRTTWTGWKCRRRCAPRMRTRRNSDWHHGPNRSTGRHGGRGASGQYSREMATTSQVRVQFDAFDLDEANARLTRHGRPLALPPRAFAVLCALARHPGQLVTKSDLLDAVWGHQFVSDSVLKTTVSEVRAVLGDDARQPRYIETASRRGYRFIGVLGARPGSVVEQMPEPLPPLRGDVTIVGREDPLQRLRAAWRLAQQGTRQLCWVSGEAGVGKTTLIDAFVDSLEGTALVVRGHCVEPFGQGEPYLPVLEILGTLGRMDERV